MLSAATRQQRDQFQQTVAAATSIMPAASGSRTMTLAPEQPPNSNPSETQFNIPRNTSGGILRLRGGPRSRPQVAWTEDVVDNEGLGRKKSKICCIYHKPRAFDESSSDESSGSDDDEGSESDGGHHGRRPPHNHNHNHRHDHDHDHDQRSNGDEPVAYDGAVPAPTGIETRSSTNAYESAPADKKGKGKQ